MKMLSNFCPEYVDCLSSALLKLTFSLILTLQVRYQRTKIIFLLCSRNLCPGTKIKTSWCKFAKILLVLGNI